MIRIVLFLAFPYRSIEQTEKPNDSDVQGERRRRRGDEVLAVRPISFALALSHIIFIGCLVGSDFSVTLPALFSPEKVAPRNGFLIFWGNWVAPLGVTVSQASMVAFYCTYMIMSAVGNHTHATCNPLTKYAGTRKGTVVLGGLFTDLALRIDPLSVIRTGWRIR